jgi:hypothetical protein
MPQVPKRMKLHFPSPSAKLHHRMHRMCTGCVCAESLVFLPLTDLQNDLADMGAAFHTSMGVRRILQQKLTVHHRRDASCRQ